ncbi:MULTISPECIES: hypothetical protein [Bacillus cereus group]|uniref:hypothetical protein n=1 Tax=Bacillus cereus group TaxID=86661 RepID=UPI000994C75B|nr:hypothetical protein [Bacillus cereus]OPA25191.1 hypothetical protein BHL53_10720 [Bacillus cereus]
MALKPYEKIALNYYQEQLEEKLNNNNINFLVDQTVYYHDSNGKKVSAQIDAIYTLNNKRYFVELYTTYAAQPNDFKDYNDNKIKADALKLVALKKEIKDFGGGIILLLYTTYRSYTASNRNSLAYLSSLGISIDYVLDYGSVSIPAMFRKKLTPWFQMTNYKKKQDKIIKDILTEIKKVENDESQKSNNLKGLKELVNQLNAEHKITFKKSK